MSEAKQSVTTLVYVRFFAAQIIGFLFNPWLLLFSLIQSIGGLVAAIRIWRRGSAAPRVVAVRLPFDGCWRVARGGVDRKQSHSWGIPAQRYAYDFIGPGEQDPNRVRLDDYPAFGQPIRASHPGVVYAAKDGYRDHPKPGTGWIDWRAADPRGNHVLVHHGGDDFALYAHLKRGSVRAAPGTKVSVGDILGECGNSGHSTEPHLHFHVQTGAHIAFGVGLPVWFSDAKPAKDHEPSQDDPAPLGFIASDQDVVASKVDDPNGSPQLPPPSGQLADVVGAVLGTVIMFTGVFGLGLAIVRILKQLL